MAIIIKPIGTEAVCNTTTFSSYGNNTLVKVSHASTTSTLVLITCKDSTNSTTRWTTSIIGGQTIFLQKGTTDLLTSNTTTATVVITPIAFKN